mgnify:CR=1 FL=1
MTHAEIKSLEDAGRSTMVWSSDIYDGASHYGDVARALIPAMVILATVAALLLALL